MARKEPELPDYDSEFPRNVRRTAVRNNSTKSARDMFFYADDGLLPAKAAKAAGAK